MDPLKWVPENMQDLGFWIVSTPPPNIRGLLSGNIEYQGAVGGGVGKLLIREGMSFSQSVLPLTAESSLKNPGLQAPKA